MCSSYKIEGSFILIENIFHKNICFCHYNILKNNIKYFTYIILNLKNIIKNKFSFLNKNLLSFIIIIIVLFIIFNYKIYK